MFRQGRGWGRVIGICVMPAIFIFSLQDLLGATKTREFKEKPLIVTPSGQCRATDIINHVVKNDRGETLGGVDDLVISQNGKIEKVVLSVGNFLGVEEKLIAVSFTSLKIDKKGNILYRVTKEQLEKYPVYTSPKEYPYGIYYTPYHFYGPSDELYPPDKERYYPYPIGKVPFSPGKMTISPLLGRRVISYEGDPLGSIDDFIIHLEEGNIEKIIVSVNGPIKEGSVDLPFTPLELSVWGIYYNITKEDIGLLLDLKDMEEEKIVSPEKPK
jgi:sporulation protein YlmC with PRC-barrel domain